MYTENRTFTIHTNEPVAPTHVSRRRVRKRTDYIVSILLGALVLAALFIASAQTSVSEYEQHNYQLRTAVKPEELSVVSPVVTPYPAIIIKEPTYTEYEVPAAETGFKAYMGYHAITSTTSTQWAMQQDAWTDELGFRRYGNFYMVAMGTYYGTECGSKFHITMESGAEFDVITGDIKADRDTDALHQHRNGNVLEFIVDSNEIPAICRVAGDMSNADDMFAGKIASIRSHQAQ